MRIVSIILLALIMLSMRTVLISSLIMIPSVNADNKPLKGRSIPIPDNPLTPPNQSPAE
jgi:hypothetical protein